MSVQRYKKNYYSNSALPVAGALGVGASVYGPLASKGMKAAYDFASKQWPNLTSAQAGNYAKASIYAKGQTTKRQKKVAQVRSLRGQRGVPLITEQQRNIPGGESRSNFRLVKSMPYLYRGPTKFLGLNSVNRSAGFNATSVQGKQTAINLGAYFNYTDIINIFTDVGETVTATNSGKVLLLEARAKAIITNSETTNSHFTIFEVMAKQDAGALNTDPASTFLAGCADANGGASTDATIPGTSPFSNPRFMQSYKILQKTPIVLAPGMTHVHESVYIPNRIISQERAVISGVAGGPLGGLTVWTFIVMHGTPVHGSAAITTVTLGSSSLDIVLLEEIKFKQMVRDYAFNSITTTLNTALATPEQVAQATDAEVLETHT